MHADTILLARTVELLNDTDTDSDPDADAAPGPRSHDRSHDRTLHGVAVTAGRITAVGPAELLAPLRGPATTVHEFPDAAILPGLTDAHAHPVWGAISTGSGTDLSGAVTLDEVLARLADAAAGHPADDWITGFDLDVNVFDGEPHGAFLAEHLPGRPVSLLTRDAHALVVSPRAVELSGLTGRESFTDASSVVVDGAGRPTGYVLELQAMDLVFAHYPEVPLDTAAAHVRAQLERFARSGLTGLHALDFGEPSEEVFRHLEERGELPLRVRCSPLVPADSTPDVWQRIAGLQGLGGRRWHVDGVKFMLDGTADNGTAWFEHPDVHGENREPLWRDTDAYRAAVRFFTGRGIPTATHAIGDRAVRFALDVFEETGRAPRAPHRIEHLESVPDDLLPRFARLDVVAGLQPVHATRQTRADGTDNWSRRIGPERAARGWRTRDLLDHGAVVALGSDWPIGPGDPRVGLADCQLRRPVEEPDAAPVQPGQAVTAREAYRAMTVAAAYAAGADGELGRIAPGFTADLTVLAANPLDLDPGAQAVNPVLATVVGGAVQLHHRLGAAAPAPVTAPKDQS
ncbi:amidohydrolase [Kitasatospora purpeofusca]|uniref:amidohydrolase n=1 Tax=Kitasatospora purpeofusca TaxID=67352 RepID=UPI00224F8F48|nr:amidohydrolase [Kitasatospora purpeofusca]MCX4683436.1 amidohydrolase [Kitasatospora purpeofusca]